MAKQRPRHLATVSARAWGEPAIIARCGLPPQPPTTRDCLRVNDIDWVIRRLSDGAAFTTYGTDPAIEVLVPGKYRPEPTVLPVFAAAASTLPRTGRHCT